MQPARFFLLPLTLFATFSLSSCLDVVDVNLPDTAPLLVVDGTITDQAAPPVVKLSLTQAYFKDSAPPVVRGATLRLTDDLGTTEVLRETDPGTYVGSGALRGRIGGSYVLTIAANGQQYRAETEIRRTPGIDSLTLEYRKQFPFDEGYYPIYYGPELPGVGDYYRFKVYRNGKLLNEPGDLIVRADELVDGNYIGHIEMTDKPLLRGDKVKVELNAISRDYFYFLNEMFTQINNVGLFATSPANVRTNVRNLDPQAGPAQAAVGYFAGYPVRADSVTMR